MENLIIVASASVGMFVTALVYSYFLEYFMYKELQNIIINRIKNDR